MSSRDTRGRHPLMSVVGAALALVLLATIAFALARAGRSVRLAIIPDSFDPEGATFLVFGFTGLMSFLSVLLVMDRDPYADRIAGRERPGPPAGQRRLFTSEPYRGLVSIGAVFGACLALGALLWRLMAGEVGDGDSFWAGYGSRPLTVLTLFLAVWASSALGTSALSLMISVRRRQGIAVLLALASVLLGCGVAVLFWWMTTMPETVPLLISVVALPLSLLLLKAAHARMARAVGREKVQEAAQATAPPPAPQPAPGTATWPPPGTPPPGQAPQRAPGQTPEQ